MSGLVPLVSVVILDYNKGRRTVANVQSLMTQEVNFAFEIIVADNSCNPENARQLKALAGPDNLRLIINAENLGYTKGCNQAAREARGSYILIVNPDIFWPEPHALQQLVDYLEAHPDVGIVGPRQLDEDGTATLTAREFPRFLTQIARRTALNKLPGLAAKVARDEMRHADLSRTQAVDWLQSSCILIRRGLWDTLGGFDERYFMFMADPEICRQSWARGQKVVYHAAALVHADGIRSSRGGIGALLTRWTLRQHVKDAALYHLRHFGQRNPRLSYEASTSR